MELNELVKVLQSEVKVWSSCYKAYICPAVSVMQKVEDLDL